MPLPATRLGGSGFVLLLTSQRQCRKDHKFCSTCGSVSKAKLKEQSVVISPHPPRKSRPVRNVTRWMEQESDWVLAQKKE